MDGVRGVLAGDGSDVEREHRAMGLRQNGPAGGHEALDVYRKYAVLNMSLFPYRYAAAQEAAKTGMPMMRALALLYQDDARARAAKDEYLFGPDFLVAPVIDEGTQRAVYLPAGEWVDYWTGAEIAGGKVVVVEAPLDGFRCGRGQAR